MDDQQRARELRKQAAEILAAAYKDAHFFRVMDDALSDKPSPHCQVTITAITAALRAAPEGFVIVRAGAVKPSNCGANHHHCCRACGADLGGISARPQGVKDRPSIDGCTESNCKRCRTHPNHRGDMEHAGIGWRPDSPQEASDA